MENSCRIEALEKYNFSNVSHSHSPPPNHPSSRIFSMIPVRQQWIHFGIFKIVTVVCIFRYSPPSGVFWKSQHVFFSWVRQLSHPIFYFCTVFHRQTFFKIDYTTDTFTNIPSSPNFARFTFLEVHYDGAILSEIRS